MKRLLLLVFIFTLCSTSRTGAETALSDFYKVGANDVLEIRVLDHDELKTVTTVTSDGTITFPYIGNVSVSGMSLQRIEEIITKKLSEGYIKYPVVTVSLIRSLSKKIFTYGELNRRGEIPLEEDVTVLQALSMANGVTVDGKDGTVKILRKKEGKGKEYITIAETILNDGVIEDKKVELMYMKSGDVLVVDRNKTFLIQGEAMQRGRFVLQKDMTVLNALLRAGGVSTEGRFGKIRIRHKKSITDDYIDIAESKLNDGVIEDKKVENMLLNPDDILIVERSDTFLIQGEASQRGRFVLEKDMTIIQALLQAGGASKDGVYGSLILRRKQQETGTYEDIAKSELIDGVIEDKKVENMILQPDDILIVNKNKTFTIHGEIGAPGKYVLEEGMTVLRALAIGRGIRNEGTYGKVIIRRKRGSSEEYQDIEVNLGKIIKGEEAQDILLQPDDILMVEQNETYFVYGEVQRPGEYVLKEGMTAFKAITIAGGFTKWGSGKRVKILRPREDNKEIETIKINIDDVISGDAAADVFLEPGDSVIISAGVF